MKTIYTEYESDKDMTTFTNFKNSEQFFRKGNKEITLLHRSPDEHYVGLACIGGEVRPVEFQTLDQAIRFIGEYE